jgi:hypothetical protein
MLLQEISQILATTGNIYASQEEKILTTFKNIPALQEIEDQKFHEKQGDLEVFPDSPYESREEIKNPWTTFDEEQTLELEVEEFPANLYPDPLCKSQLFEDLQGMIKKDMQSNATNEEDDQMSSDYIEEWFQIVIRSGYHSILQHFLASSPLKQLASHILYLLRYTSHVWIWVHL